MNTAVAKNKQVDCQKEFLLKNAEIINEERNVRNLLTKMSGVTNFGNQMIRRYSTLQTSLGINPMEEIPQVDYDESVDDAMFIGMGEKELRQLEKSLLLFYPKLRQHSNYVQAFLKASKHHWQSCDSKVNCPVCTRLYKRMPENLQIERKLNNIWLQLQ